MWSPRATDRPGHRIPGTAASVPPSFTDVLAAARRELWRERILVGSDRDRLSTEFQAALLEALADAA